MRPLISIPVTPAVLAACEEADAWIRRTGGTAGEWLAEHVTHPQILDLARIAADGDHDNASWEQVLAEVRRLAADAREPRMGVPDTVVASVGSWWAMRAATAGLRPGSDAPPIVRLVVEVHGDSGERRWIADEHGMYDYLATDIPVVADICQPPYFSRRRAIEKAAGLEPHASDQWLPSATREDLCRAAFAEPSGPSLVPHIDAILAILRNRNDDQAQRTRAWMASIPASGHKYPLTTEDKDAIKRADADFAAGRFLPGEEMILRVALVRIREHVAPALAAATSSDQALAQALKLVVDAMERAADYIQERRLHMAPPPPNGSVPSE